MEPIHVDYYEYLDAEGICVLGCKNVLPDGQVIIHGEEPPTEDGWVAIGELRYNAK